MPLDRGLTEYGARFVEDAKAVAWEDGDKRTTAVVYALCAVAVEIAALRIAITNEAASR